MAAIINNANNTIKTRIQLKSDTETNWNKAGPKDNSPGFIPLAGELIIYTPDNTHNYSRLKVGDGSTNVTLLPFIDAGTVNGDTIVNEIVYVNDIMPVSGDSTKLYVNTLNNAIYYYDGLNWQKLSNYTYTITTSDASTISRWDKGSVPTFSMSGGSLTIKFGTEPTLNHLNTPFVKSVTKEASS